MKKMFLILCAGVLMTSCYTSTVCVGDLGVNDPAIEINRKSNPHFICGLISPKSTKCKASDFIGQNKAYKVVRTQTFVDGLLGCITLGIYTPTTTIFYRADK